MPLPPSFNPGFYANFEARMNRKYDILAEEAAAKTLSAKGEYARNIADAQSLPGYREALGFHARGAGQLSLEQAATEAARRYMDPDWLRGAFRQMYETGQLPGYTRTPGAGAPDAGTPGAGASAAPAGPAAAPAPIQFQTMPGYPAAGPAAPAAPAARVAADVPETPDVMTSDTPIEEMTPEQLSQWTSAAATPRGVQGPAAPSGQAAQQRLREAQARQPSLLRPTAVPTSRVSGATPLYSTGFQKSSGLRRGTANVSPQGYAEGDADVLLRRPLFGAVGGRGAPGFGGAPTTPANLPGGPAPVPLPPSVPSQPGPFPGPASPLPQGPMSQEDWQRAGGGGPAPGQPVGPGYGTPYDPNAGYGIENLGGIVDATLRLVNPDRFAAAMAASTPSQNIEDRRGEVYNPNAPSSIASNIGGQIAGGGQQLASDVWRTIVGDQPAAPGSLAQQAGYNDIGGGSPGLVSSVSDYLGGLFGGGGTAATTQAPGESAAPAPAPSGGDTGSDETGYRKGSANVKGKGSKAPKAGGSPKGLEALLPILAAMQGGGAGGPPAGPGGPPAGPGGPPAPPTPGMKKGTVNVKGYKRGSPSVKGKSKGGKSDKSSTPTSDQPPTGLEAILPALMMASKGGGAAGPQAANALPPSMGPGAAAPPGFAEGVGDIGSANILRPAIASVTPLISGGRGGGGNVGGGGGGVKGPNAPMPAPVYAKGTPSVQPRPNYPFGAGYMFGANEVPGQGTGRTDTVPAMLAPHEAVLNKAAADILGRGLIAALNAQGVKQMGMGRGAAT